MDLRLIAAPQPTRAARSARDARRRRAERGFTFIEVLLATVIVGITLTAVSWTMTSAVQAKATLSSDPTAYLLAREIRELAGSLPRAPSGIVGVTSAADVAALDSLHGAVFSPPVRANRTAQSTLSGWTQQVALSVCTLDDLTTATGEDPTLGISSAAERLYRLSVIVKYSGQEVERFTWWLTP